VWGRVEDVDSSEIVNISVLVAILVLIVALKMLMLVSGIYVIVQWVLRYRRQQHKQ
jgi:hypothetical protein